MYSSTQQLNGPHNGKHSQDTRLRNLLDSNVLRVVMDFIRMASPSSAWCSFDRHCFGIRYRSHD